MFTKTPLLNISSGSTGLQRVSTSPENAARIMETCDKINVRALLPSVSVPTLVFHCDRDRVVPAQEGRILASEIPNARFVPLTSANHLLLPHEPAWGIFVEELGRFLGWQAGADNRPSLADERLRMRILGLAISARLSIRGRSVPT